MDNKLTDLFVSALHQLMTAAQRFRDRSLSVKEIGSLDAQEMARLARDLGTSRDDLRILAATDKNAAELLDRRMKTIGLDPAHVDSMVMRDLQRCCSKCVDKRLCVHELEDQPREPTWPRYCPNEQTLAALKEEQADKVSDVP